MPDLEALYCAKCAMSASNGAWSAGTRPDTEASSCAECAVSASEGAGSKGTKAPGLLIQICPEQLLYFVPTGTVDFVLLAPVYFVLLAPVLGSASEGTGFKGAGQDLEASYCSECAISASDGTWSKEPGQIQRRRPALSAPCPRQKALGPKSKGAGSKGAGPDPEAPYCAKCAGSLSEGTGSKVPKAPGQNAHGQIQRRPTAPSAQGPRLKATGPKVQRRQVRMQRNKFRAVLVHRVRRVCVQRHQLQRSKGAGSEDAGPDPEALYCVECAVSASDGAVSKGQKAPGSKAPGQIRRRPTAPSAQSTRPKAQGTKVQRRRVQRSKGAWSEGARFEVAGPDTEASSCATCAVSASKGARSKSPKASGPQAPSPKASGSKAPGPKAPGPSPTA
eukprot:CAMPEP_0194345298 /NCGR_PEP_ID=MMETSP0171-20130528/104774_1 /TAXON_ID=218684 /ORGANISM="Corethron pennatum, Strain L29A3" /LENGTH=389 /DNA_ID=CAMNT_0039112263 /DNA_START=1348 /DNA_END=2518 /DNA_ORIENTATION=-